MSSSESGGGPGVAVRELTAGTRPSLRWLFLMLSVEFAAFAMLIPIVPFFLIHEIGLGPEQVGVLLSANSLAQVIGAWSSGRASDALGRHPVITAVFAWAGFGFGATAFTHTFEQVLVVRIMQGLSGGTAALCDAYLLDEIPMDQGIRASYMGLAGAVKGLSFVFGPGVGAMLIHKGVARRQVFLFSGLLALIASGIGQSRLEESLDKSKRRPLCAPRRAGGVGVGVASWDGVNGGMLCIWFCRFTSALGLGFLFATYAFLIQDNFGWSDQHFGMVLFASGLVGAALQLLAFPRLVSQLSAAWTFILGSIVGVISFLLMPEPTLWVHVLSLACFTLKGAMTEPCFAVLIGDFADDHHQGFANGMTTSCRALATMMSPFIAGSLYKRSKRLAYYSGAACYLCSAIGALFISRCQKAGKQR